MSYILFICINECFILKPWACMNKRRCFMNKCNIIAAEFILPSVALMLNQDIIYCRSWKRHKNQLMNNLLFTISSSAELHSHQTCGSINRVIWWANISGTSHAAYIQRLCNRWLLVLSLASTNNSTKWFSGYKCIDSLKHLFLFPHLRD